MKWNKK